MSNIFFDSWDSMVRTLIITILAYVIMIVFLRIAGKRSLSKMNAFDFVVTIALGSTLATVMLNKNVALTDGVLAFALLLSLQMLITWGSSRSQSINRLVKSTPALLVYKGEMLQHVMNKERITQDEVYAMIRSQGLSSIKEAEAVVLETNGSLTVITGNGSADDVLSGKVLAYPNGKYPD